MRHHVYNDQSYSLVSISHMLSRCYTYIFTNYTVHSSLVVILEIERFDKINSVPCFNMRTQPIRIAYTAPNINVLMNKEAYIIIFIYIFIYRMGTNFRGCLIFAFFAVWFEICEFFILNKNN